MIGRRPPEPTPAESENVALRGLLEVGAELVELHGREHQQVTWAQLERWAAQVREVLE